MFVLYFGMTLQYQCSLATHAILVTPYLSKIIRGTASTRVPLHYTTERVEGKIKRNMYILHKQTTAKIITPLFIVRASVCTIPTLTSWGVTARDTSTAESIYHSSIIIWAAFLLAALRILSNISILPDNFALPDIRYIPNDHQGRLGAVNLGPFVSADLNLWPTVYTAVIMLTVTQM